GRGSPQDPETLPETGALAHRSGHELYGGENVAMTTTKWDFDLSHSSINFWVRHLMVAKVRGRFGSWRGTLEFSEDNPLESKVEVEIDAASIDTKDEARDKHLRSA